MANPVANPSFETPGADYGQADSWTEEYTECGEQVARFFYHSGTRRPNEDFESSWDDNHLYQLTFGLTDIVRAMFCGNAVVAETFEFNWHAPVVTSTDNSGAIFVFSLDNFQVATFTGAFEVDDFEYNWGVSPYCQGADNDGFDAGADARLTAASFDPLAPENVEDFEGYWQNNQMHDADGFNPGADARLTAATFDAAPFVPGENYEDFEESWTSTLP